MANDILHTLISASLIASVVIPLLCAARVPLRRAFGARIAYMAWAAVPAAMLAMATLSSAHMPAPVQPIVAPLHHLANAGAGASPASTGPQWHQWLLAAWLVVAVAMLAWYGVAHRRYRQHIGLLRRDGDIYHSKRTDAGPAVVGLWRPMIVLPADFATRYTAQEQQLILAHEAVHVHRCDPLMNAICAAIQCALWFHPLVHLAARRFRQDQELACDAVVMLDHPLLKRSYADAMLKTQISTQTALIHCQWQSTHPLKERLMQLQKTPPSMFRRVAGRIAVTTFIAACGYGAMAANAGVESTDKYLVKMKLNAGGETSAPTLLMQEGVPAAVASQGKDGIWRTELLLSKASDTSVFVKAFIKHDDQVVSSPGLLVAINETAAVAVGNFKLQLDVSRQRD
ncbi:M56 family metallopeptidase [Duganella sp. sic0402]|uniref:M56 family metallopeptidase n=1 Tax=Duganella sp. sic0402 TaxID=2854786 RepID=UPI001C48AFC8|nr:M56 family metallopeptidase [Duganella sp. sic0402]MBV7534580.1 M56 family metallopeptidase [Duganella sp. sic0402]